jgi:hypothetical protein
MTDLYEVTRDVHHWRSKAMRKRYRGPLHAGTRDQHHAVETDTRLGRIMTSGEITAPILAEWLGMKLDMFRLIDRHIPPSARRAAQIMDDLAALGITPRPLEAIKRHQDWLKSATWPPDAERRLTGTIYVTCGGMFGAAEIATRLKGGNLPTSALRTRDPETEMAFLNQLRYRADCIAEAIYTFETFGAACREIAARLGLEENA